MNSNSIGKNNPLPSTQTHLPPITKKTGSVMSRLFGRLQFDAQSTPGKSNTVAMIKFSDGKNPLSRIKNALITRAINKSKLLAVELTSTDSAGNTVTKKVAVNVNSLAKRLGLDANQFTIGLARDTKKMGEVLTNVYHTTASEKTREFFTGNGYGTVNPKELAQLFLSRVSNPSNHSTTHTIGNHQFTTFGDLLLHEDASQGQKLGKGTFGTAYRTLGLSLETLAVSEYARKVSNTSTSNLEFAETAKADLQHEANNLAFISEELAKSPNSSIEKGIQDPPRAVFFRGIRGHMVGKLYKGDCWDISTGSRRLANSEKIKGLDGLVRGLAFTQKIGLIHVDIKPENIFYDMDAKGNPQFKLADWGGARNVRNLPSGGDLPIGLTITPHYVPASEEYLSRQCTKENLLPLQRLSSFEMGASIFEMLAGNDKTPYPRTPQNTLMTGAPFNREALNAYPESVIAFVAELMHPNPQMRPVGDALTERWNALINEFGSLEQMCQKADEPKDNSRAAFQFRRELLTRIPGLMLQNPLNYSQVAELMKNSPNDTWLVCAGDPQQKAAILYKKIAGQVFAYTIFPEHIPQLQRDLHPGMQWRPDFRPPVAQQDVPI